MDECIYLYVCVCVYIYIYTHTHTCVCVYGNVCVNVLHLYIRT